MIIKSYDICSFLGLRPLLKPNCAAILYHVEHATKGFDPEVWIKLDYDCSIKNDSSGIKR